MTHITAIAAMALLMSGSAALAQDRDMGRLLDGQEEAGPRGSIFMDEPQPDQSVPRLEQRQAETSRPAAGARQVAATRDTVYQVQRDLQQLGYDVGPIDGLYGPRTREAIQAFQRDQELPESGDITLQLLATLDEQDTQQAQTPGDAELMGEGQGVGPADIEPPLKSEAQEGMFTDQPGEPASGFR